MDSDSGHSGDDKAVVEIFVADTKESSEDPPMEEWSSLEILGEEDNPKRILYEEGLYDPGDGDICDQYIAQSASSVIRHVYYRYPALIDPGIMKALLKPEDPVIYPDDGQELYLAICKEMKQCTVKIFYRGLLESEINLRYYGVNPKGVRAMAFALKYNKFVKLLNLTDNFLIVDSCYHLGDMLISNSTLVELNLEGCRIGPDGLRKLLAGMLNNRSVRALNLSKNLLGDEGMECFAQAVMKGLDIKMINLSYNNISGKGVRELVEPFETHNKFTHWNLSWNNLFSPGTYNFLCAIAESTKHVKKMDLSWNSLTGPRVALGIRNLMLVPDLKHLNLSNNKLEGEAIKTISTGLAKAKKLVSLNLSYNPMTPEDVNSILQKMKLRAVSLYRLYLDNVPVNSVSLSLIKDVRVVKRNLIITYGMVVGTFVAVGPDFRDVLMNRLEFLCKKPKKNKVDIVVFVLEQLKEKVTALMTKQFLGMVARRGATLDPDLVESLATIFPGPRTDKGDKTINLETLMEFLKRKWPDRKLPPTPPPELEPEPVPAKKDKKDGKK